MARSARERNRAKFALAQYRERENPYAPPISPGHLVQRPTVRLGVRRPITSRTR